MYSSYSDLVKTLATVAGICGPLFTAGKSVVLFAKDQSLERKRRKMIEEISECLDRLHTLDAPLPTTDLQLEPYRLQITADVQDLIAELRAVRDKTLLRESRRDKESTGIRRWLLLYRPEGLNGWLAQSFFFGTFAALVFIVIISLRKPSVDLGRLVISTVFMVIWLLYARSVSLRLKDIGTMRRQTGIRELNSDLNWIRRALLLFKPTGISALVEHCFFYIFAFAIVSPIQEPMSASLKVVMIGGSLLTAKIFQVDALARRALGTELVTAPRGNDKSSRSA